MVCQQYGEPGKRDLLALSHGAPRSWEPGFWEWVCAQKSLSQNKLLSLKGQEQGVGKHDSSMGATCLQRGSAPCCSWAALEIVFSGLSPTTLARARTVCRTWRDVATLPAVRRACFQQHWRLAGVEGEPRSPSFLECATLRNFVVEHSVVRGDTLPALAVRYSSSVTEIKRTNNMTTDNALHSRTHLYIPVHCVEEVYGRRTRLQFCDVACREFIVLQPLSDAEKAAEEAPRPQPTTAHSDMMAAKMSALLARSLHVDDHTARFYLELTGGDVRAAIAAAEEDARWERGSGSGHPPSGMRRGQGRAHMATSSNHRASHSRDAGAATHRAPAPSGRH